MSEPRPIMSTEARLALGILSADDVQRAHAAALELLGEDPAASEQATTHQAPLTLAGRMPEHDVVLAAGRCWLAAGPLDTPAALVRPLDGGDPRPAARADLDDACRLADALPEVALLAGPPLRPQGTTPLEAVAQTLRATTKHVLATALSTAGEALAAARLAAAVAGRGRPLPLSLCAGPEGHQAAVAAARAGLAVGLVLPAGAEAGEAGLAAALVRHHAGVLAGRAAVRAEAPEAPFFYVASPAMAGLPALGPTAAMFQIAATQLAAHIGLAVVTGGMATGSHAPDWEACTQDSLAALSCTAAGANVTAGAGLLGGGSAFSLQQLVLDSEIYSWNAMIARGIQVDDETIALDAIKDVGVGGNFLSQRHTRRHMRDVWRPRLLDRSMWDAWVASGREGAPEKATALATRLVTEHEVAPLDDEVQATIARIVAEAGL